MNRSKGEIECHVHAHLLEENPTKNKDGISLFSDALKDLYLCIKRGESPTADNQRKKLCDVVTEPQSL